MMGTAVQDLKTFTTASRQSITVALRRRAGTGNAKSKLSRRIAMLEEWLGVRLIQRPSRRFVFVVTEAGQTYYEHCKAMLVEAEAAQEAIDAMRAESRGIIRLACPVTLLHVNVGVMLADFMAHYPTHTTTPWG